MKKNFKSYVLLGLVIILSGGIAAVACIFIGKGIGYGASIETQEELAEKLNRNLGNDIIAGKGMLIASECINKGVDPYVATSIILHETGCKTKCSNLARYCYNFGGQKGKPSCNGGSFKKFDTIDAGLVGMINNLYKNYYAMGLNTVETIAPKYCEGNTWAGKINWFVNSIRNS